MNGIKTRLIAAGLIGAAAIIAPLTYQFEGSRNQVYVDPVGVLTVCVGHVSPELRKGEFFTDEQCTEKFIKDLRWAESTVNRCTPNLPETMKPALIDFAFNIGSGAYCSSTLAKLANNGEYVAACQQIYRWVKNAPPGLLKRRKEEARLCLEGVPRG